MVNREEKIERFLQAMTEHAEEQGRRIHEEVETYKKERLLNAERQVFDETHRRLAREREDLKRELSREFSARDREARERLLRRREEMVEKVFSAAKEKLAAFQKTPAYDERLRQSLHDMREALPAEGTVYQLGSMDASKREALSALCPAGSRVEIVADIRLGGLRGVSADAGQVLDDTLDTALKAQESWFRERQELWIDMEPMGLGDAL